MTLLPEIEDMNMPIEGVFHNLTIVKIRKEFPGHAQKVMNAMWGAGQMMFNKILVITDANVDIHNHTELARYISQHSDPATDIYFSSGPMDVLDHSCSKFAFGGKICIDATAKFEEERQAQANPSAETIAIDISAIRAKYPEITLLNPRLLQSGISVVAIAVEKTRAGQIRELHRALVNEPGFAGLKFIVYVDHTVEAEDIGVVVWNCSNNIDAKRDVLIENGICGFDGTRKSMRLDNFDRPWPNVIVMDDATIERIDQKWSSLGIGEFISSPSLKYKRQVQNAGAVFRE
jgi:4-hydroxy-3-polyprenylbenzoate decarboxylase